MNETIAKLLQMHRLDSQIAALEDRAAAGLAAVAQEVERLEASRQERQKTSEAVKAKRIEADKGNLDLKSVEAEIEKIKAQFVAAKSNREYSLIKEKISGLDKKKEALEEKALLLMEEADEMRAALREIERDVEAAELSLQETRRRAEESGASAASEIKDLCVSRKAASAGLSPEDLELYESIRKHRGGKALAEVKGETCTACFMGVSKQKMNQLMMAQAIITCDSCKRILYRIEADAAAKVPGGRGAS